VMPESGQSQAHSGVSKKSGKDKKGSSQIDKKWKDVSWSGAANTYFKSLPRTGKDMLKHAYLHYAVRVPDSIRPPMTYHVRYLANFDSFGAGRLFPGYSAHTAWPSFLTHLYTAVYECVRYASVLVGWDGALQREIVDRCKEARGAFDKWLKDHEESLSSEARDQLRAVFDKYEDIRGVASNLAYPCHQLSDHCVYYDGKGEPGQNYYY
jgi:hypothetical protein